MDIAPDWRPAAARCCGDDHSLRQALTCHRLRALARANPGHRIWAEDWPGVGRRYVAQAAMNADPSPWAVVTGDVGELAAVLAGSQPHETPR